MGLCAGRPRLDVTWFHGGRVPGGGVRAAAEHSGQTAIHEPAGTHTVRVPHHHGGGQAVNTWAAFNTGEKQKEEKTTKIYRNQARRGEGSG